MPQTLLLADDSVTIQRVIELTFADEDIKVVAVSDGNQAIAQLDSGAPPDIVLADIGMPGKTGYEVAEYIKKSPRLSHIPVVLLTGAFEPVDQVKANAVGCDGVLAKPFEPQLVIGRVKELLSRPGRPAADAAATLAPAATPAAPPAESWAASFAAQPGAEASPASGGRKLDDYFDRLDAAFASFSGGSAPEPTVALAPEPQQPNVPPPVPSEIDWFGSQPSAAPSPDLALSYGSPESDFIPPPPVHSPTPQRMVAPSETFAAPEPPTETGAAAPAPPAPAPAPAAPAASAPTTSTSLPPLADAFAALLAAEQDAPAPTTAPAWPGTPGGAAAVTDDVVEQVARRVLERLSDRVVREAVAEIVSEVAERLIKEEIDRIKGSIK